MLSPASSTMIFMGRLQSNAPVSAAAMARNLSNLVPAPAFQPMKMASVFDMRHIAHRPLCTISYKIKPGMRDGKYPQRSRSRGPGGYLRFQRDPENDGGAKRKAACVATSRPLPALGKRKPGTIAGLAGADSRREHH